MIFPLLIASSLIIVSIAHNNCSQQLSQALRHCTQLQQRSQCLLEELNKECEKELCEFIDKGALHEKCRIEGPKVYLEQIEFSLNKPIENIKKMVDLNQKLLDCPPKLYEECKGELGFSVLRCQSDVQCIFDSLVGDCKQCAETIRSLINFKGVFESYMPRQGDYQIPKQVWEIKGNLQALMISKWEAVSKSSFEGYCDIYWRKINLVCASENQEKRNNCLRSLLFLNICRSRVCETHQKFC